VNHSQSFFECRRLTSPPSRRRPRSAALYEEGELHSVVFGSDALSAYSKENLQSYVDEQEAGRVAKQVNNAAERLVEPPMPNTPWERIQFSEGEQDGGPMHKDKSSLPVRHSTPVVVCLSSSVNYLLQEAWLISEPVGL
jgi:hypothetical protein